MPPIPTTLDGDILAQVDALERRQKDLKDFQIPRLRTFDGPLATQQQYAGELREDIDTFSRQIEVGPVYNYSWSLGIAVDDQKGDRNKRELRRIVDEYREVLASFRKESRGALLTSKRAIDAKRTSNREELFRSNAVREKQDLNEKVAEDAVMTASNNLTEALQRTMTLMQGELEKSVLSTQLLDQSTASLRSASTTHDVLDGLLSTSKHLITALEKSDWVDRVIIIAALVFFVLVVLFILKQRLVDRSIRIAFWWTRFLPGLGSNSSKTSDKVADALEKGSLTSMATEVASTFFRSIQRTKYAPI
ncbi:Sec20-domain-containing protein [Irpex rosettiformis]|uniref:Sec20-domain-containing protein n=1 Tax=Irpex rosettiformis TaxID=378272 RepID=A0ACB8U7W8_9APHY|nr:Sec20-domain-containing protein [Irpex rosettiformis]